MKKLTLSADEGTIREAKNLANESGTSVSSMFERFVRSLSRRRKPVRPVGPIARKATGVIRLPAGKSERTVLEDALVGKYKLRK